MAKNSDDSKKNNKRKYYYSLYILRSQSIWSLHFGRSQFSLYYFHLAVNLIPTVNSPTKNIYVVNRLHSQHTKLLCLMFGVIDISFFAICVSHAIFYIFYLVFSFINYIFTKNLNKLFPNLRVCSGITYLWQLICIT